MGKPQSAGAPHEALLSIDAAALDGRCGNTTFELAHGQSWLAEFAPNSWLPTTQGHCRGAFINQRFLLSTTSCLGVRSGAELSLAQVAQWPVTNRPFEFGDVLKVSVKTFSFAPVTSTNTLDLFGLALVQIAKSPAEPIINPVCLPITEEDADDEDDMCHFPSASTDDHDLRRLPNNVCATILQRIGGSTVPSHDLHMFECQSFGPIPDTSDETTPNNITISESYCISRDKSFFDKFPLEFCLDDKTDDDYDLTGVLVHVLTPCPTPETPISSGIAVYARVSHFVNWFIQTMAVDGGNVRVFT